MKQVIGLVLLVVLFAYSGLAQDQTDSGGSRGSPSGRIVNGTAVSIEKYPYIVRIRFRSSFICGGSIITNRHVLSAAQCFIYSARFSAQTEEVTVMGGSADLNSGVVFPVHEFIVHPDFNYAGLTSDAAIVTISDTFDGYSNIAAIPLQTREITYSPDNPTWCFAAGWGFKNRSVEQASENLQLVWMQVISQYRCVKEYDYPIAPEIICAELPRTDACIGDSGGPLVCHGQLSGIISFGDPDCTGATPTGFTKVTSTSIRAFIREHAGI